MRVTLKNIARHFPTAIVSGRCLDKVHFFNKIISSFLVFFFYLYIINMDFLYNFVL